MRRLSGIHLYKRFFIDFSLNDFRDYSKIVEQQFKDSLQKFEKEASELTPDEQEEYFDHYYDEWSPFKNDFPKIHRSSLFISIYSFLESALINLCKRSYGKYHLSSTYEDISGNGIERAKIYLTKVAEIDFPSNTKEWQFIKLCNDIRNCIVHNQSYLNSDSKKAEKLENQLKKTPLINVDVSGEITIEEGFCNLFIDTLESFLNKLFTIVGEKDKQMVR
ncbi:MAG: hypothetical protein LPK26_04755 [Bacillaceae bacterium]|nr:hypothetical protein [Bacillaceae bacterium]